MQVWPKITHAMEMDRNPCITEIVSLPTDLSQICLKFILTEKESNISDNTFVISARWEFLNIIHEEINI